MPPWNAPGQYPPTVAAAVQACASPPPTQFTEDGAAECAAAMGMGETCESAAVAYAAGASASGFGASGSVSASGSASVQKGCSNMALMYQNYQQTNNTVNCINNSSSASTNVQTSQVNSITIDNCALCGGMNSNDVPCPPCYVPCPPDPITGLVPTENKCPSTTCGNISQENIASVSVTTGLTAQYSNAISNLVSQNLAQTTAAMQTTETGSGSTATGSKSMSEASTKIATNATNQQMNTAISDAITNTTQNNTLHIKCGTGDRINCFGCSSLKQVNTATVLVSNIVNVGMTTSMATSGTFSTLQQATTEQSAKSKGADAAFSYTGVGGNSSGSLLILLLLVGAYFYAKSKSKPSAPPSRRAVYPGSPDSYY